MHGSNDTPPASATAPLAGKLAMVTGASGEIGSHVVRRLARDGASVIAHYNTGRAAADALVREVRADGGRAEALGADLARRDGAETLVAGLDGAFDGRFAGRLDVLVNNAGIFDAAPLIDVDDAAFDRLFDVNVRAAFVLAREAARRMSRSGWGRIVNIGSVFGEGAPMAGTSVYCGTKFALRGLTRAWSRDLGPAGITVNNVEPALISGDPAPASGAMADALQRFGSVGRLGGGDDVARAVAFLVRPESGYVTGASLTVDGGWSA